MCCRAVATANLKISLLKIANTSSAIFLRRGRKYLSLIDIHLLAFCCCCCCCFAAPTRWLDPLWFARKLTTSDSSHHRAHNGRVALFVRVDGAFGGKQNCVTTQIAVSKEQRIINDNVAPPDSARTFLPIFLHRLSTTQPLHHQRPTPVTSRHHNSSLITHLGPHTGRVPLAIKTSSTLKRFAPAWTTRCAHSSRCRKHPSSLPDPSDMTARTETHSTTPAKVATMVSNSASSSLLFELN